MSAIRNQLVTTAMGFAVLCNIPGSVIAQDVNVFPVPDGCTAFLTVQSRSCSISHLWTCSADPDGTHWRATLDQEGAFYLSFTDSEYRWLRAFNLRNGASNTLIEPEEDPASLSELLETGRDTMVFSIREDRPEGTFRRDYTGFDSLSGASVTVDGEVLLVTEFAYQWRTEAGPRVTEGSQFVSRRWGLFFSGLETVTTPSGEVLELNFSPMEFNEPGEPGFLSTEPQYDCGDMMSGMPIPPEAHG